MQLGIGPIRKRGLEQYSLGVMVEERLAPFEEHLLACDGCQDRFAGDGNVCKRGA